MFTGIVADMGTVRRLTRRGEDALLEVDTSLDLGDVRIGDSISVSGACLTVTAKQGPTFTADVSAETLLRTTIKALKAGDPVNLELALRLGDRMGGHIVLGHVDCEGKILEKSARSQSLLLCFDIDPAFDRYVVAKGSITVDGVSLTVNRCENSRVYVNMIPHTAAGTTLGVKKVSDAVNIETDILARYLEKLISGRAGTGSEVGKRPAAAATVDLDLLARYGYLNK